MDCRLLEACKQVPRKGLVASATAQARRYNITTVLHRECAGAEGTVRRGETWTVTLNAVGIKRQQDADISLEQRTCVL